jgi:hypothetical protein
MSNLLSKKVVKVFEKWEKEAKKKMKKEKGLLDGDKELRRARKGP